MKNINKDAKSIKEDGYSFVMNQCIKVGTHIFSLGSLAENYAISEYVITNEMVIDTYGYPCIILVNVETNSKKRERLELLSCSLHTHENNDFLTREEAENERKSRFNNNKYNNQNIYTKLSQL